MRNASAWLALALLGAACTARPGGDQEPLLVMAATSLNGVMPALIERFQAGASTEVDLVLGATGSLAAQIENGAPADVFFSADEATMARLAEGGHIRPSSVETYARGRLVLVWRDGTRPPTSLEALGDARYQAVAIANPEHAPYGAAAREALGRLGIRHAVESRIVLGENVAQAYQFVETGNADVGLVALSVALADGAPHLPVPDSLHDPILQAAGVLERSTHPDARAFLDFVLGAEGQAMLAQHGLGPRPR